MLKKNIPIIIFDLICSSHIYKLKLLQLLVLIRYAWREILAKLLEKGNTIGLSIKVVQIYDIGDVDKTKLILNTEVYLVRFLLIFFTSIFVI
jgi:hypothetical protein